MAPYLLLIAGWVFLYLEFFVPGGLLGILGTAGLVIAVVLFAFEASSLWALLLFVAAAILITALLVKVTLIQIRTAKKAHSIYLSDDQEGFKATGFDTSLIGKAAVADTDFCPAGYIVVEGHRLQAISKTGYITYGTSVMIVGGEGAHFIVKSIT